MKVFCFLLLTLALVPNCLAGEEKDVTTYLNWYRRAHGAYQVQHDAGLEYAAYEATNAVCTYGFDHHRGTEAEYSSLWADSNDCGTNTDPRGSQVAALKSWYAECPKYPGYYTDGSGHFSHMVWKSSNKYGMWAQTCSIPGSNLRCVVVLKTDTDFNVQGAFGQQVERNYCANIEEPWQV